MNFARTQYPQDAYPLDSDEGTYLHHQGIVRSGHPSAEGVIYNLGTHATGVAHPTVYVESSSGGDSRVTSGQFCPSSGIVYPSSGPGVVDFDPAYHYGGEVPVAYISNSRSPDPRRSRNFVRMIADFSKRSVQGAGQLLEHGKSLLGTPPTSLQQAAMMGIATTIPAPKPVSMVCMAGGVVLTLVSGLGLINIFNLLLAPSVYMTQAFLAVFGIATIIAEANPGTLYIGGLQPALLEWVKFLSLLSGRGLFYLFVGLIAVSLWPACFAATIVGLYYLCMAGLCIVFHIRTRHVRPDGTPNRSQRSSRMTTHAGCDDDAYPDEDHINYTDRSGV